jgi:hypothetical protein
MAEQFSNQAQSTLATGIDNDDTSLVLATSGGAAFPATGNFRVRLGTADDPNYELCIATARSTDTLTVTRAAEGRTARAWGVGSLVTHVLTAASLDTAIDDRIATHVTASVHGQFTVTFSKDGNLATGTGTHRWYNDSGRTLTISSTRGSVGTAPTTQSILVDLNKGGTSIWASTQANRITIAATTNTDQGAAPDTTTVNNGEYLTMDIDQIGSGTVGANLTVTVWLTG